MADHLYTNRLSQEKSPYLLQHAHNPVDWYPWGEEAFKVARDNDKPIFLSIGYATCHWCHVMEQESFENLEVAELMNDTFINVKVDREEQPDVDCLYMEFAQAMMSGGAGWPLNVVLTPDLMPFFAATYLPSDATRGFLGMKQLVLRIRQIWNDDEERESVTAQAGKIVDIFSNHIQPEGKELPSKEVIEEGAELLFKTADPIYGGTRGAPKFPGGYQACFLLRVVQKRADSRALFYIERTLDMMHRGGVYDHLGGGFARYAVDERWLIPHFEKMLYDNAILARVYLECWEFTRENFYREVCEEILTFLMREMVSEEGGFFSAEDADSEGREGLFYTWSWEEIHSILGNDAKIFCEFYGVTQGGNFEGRNVLHLPYSLKEFAAQFHLDPVIFANKLQQQKKKLFDVREKRPKPALDDKVLTSWNGLTIYSLAEAGRAFNKSEYIEAAVKAARFIKQNLWENEVLYRRWREGEKRHEACLDDYAFLIHGLISLFEADQGCEWLEFALILTNVLNTQFKEEKGAYYLTNGDDANLILRRCEFYDGAEPSGNAVQAENLIRLYQITGFDNYLQLAEEVLRAAKPHIDMYPPGASYHLMTLQRYLDKEAPTFVISLNDEEEYREEIAKMLSGHFLPHKAVIWRRDMDEELRDLVPLAREKSPLEGKTTLYVCHRDHCEEPISDISQMWKRLEKQH